MNKSIRKTRIIGAIVLVFVASLVYAFLLHDRFAEPDRLETTAQETFAQKNLLDLRVESLARREAQLEVSRTQAETLNARYPSAADQAGLLAEITKAAVAAGMTPDQVTAVVPGSPVVDTPAAPAAPPATEPGTAAPADPAPAAPADPGAAPAPGGAPGGAGGAGGTQPEMASMTVDITVSGSYSQIVAFFAALDGVQRALQVNSTTITSAGMGSDADPSAYIGQVNATALLMSPLPMPEIKDPEGTAPVEGQDGGTATEAPAAP